MARKKLKSSQPQKKTKLERFFYLTSKRALIITIAIVVFIIFHEFSMEIFGIKEPIGFLIVIVLLVLYIIKAAIYTFAHKRINRKR